MRGRWNATFDQLRPFPAGADVVAARLARRAGGCSDADAAVAAAMSVTARPWPDAIDIVTGDDPDSATSEALAALGMTPQVEASPPPTSHRST